VIAVLGFGGLCEFLGFFFLLGSVLYVSGVVFCVLVWGFVFWFFFFFFFVLFFLALDSVCVVVFLLWFLVWWFSFDCGWLYLVVCGVVVCLVGVVFEGVAVVIMWLFLSFFGFGLSFIVVALLFGFVFVWVLCIGCGIFF